MSNINMEHPTYATAYAIGGAPVALDYEWWSSAGPMPLDVFGDFVFAFKSRVPHLTVGVWGAPLWSDLSPLHFTKGLTPAQKTQLDAAVKRHRALVATYDVLHVACYMDRVANAEQTIDGYGLLYRWLAKAYGKPVWAWLGNWYFNEPRGADGRLVQLSRTDAANLWSMAQAEADALVLFPNDGKPENLIDWEKTVDTFRGMIRTV
jgi:hypothetical protein